MSLKLDWCSYEAAKYAVEHWHYSRRMPIGPMLKIGVWEESEYRGCVLFARGNTPTLGDRYGLAMTEVCELVRIGLRKHKAPVSRVVTIALNMLKKANGGLRLCISFADPGQGHIGGIYQAGNWVYTGESEPSWQWFHEGRWKHNREITSGAFGGARKVSNYSVLPKRLPLGKYRYLYPLDPAMRAQILPLAKPYPKRATSIVVDASGNSCAVSIDSDAPTDQEGERRASPTTALYSPAGAALATPTVALQGAAL